MFVQFPSSGASKARLAGEVITIEQGFRGLVAESSQPVRVQRQAPHRHVTIDKVEKGSKGTLVHGSAWVQFCVTKGDTEKDTVLILSKSGWVKIA